RKPLLRIWSASWLLRPSQVRFGRGIMNGLPVWFGALRFTGCPDAKTVMAVTLQPPTAMPLQSPGRYRRPNGRSHTALATARCRTSKFVGPFEQLRQLVIWLELLLAACQESESALAKVYSNRRFSP